MPKILARMELDRTGPPNTSHPPTEVCAPNELVDARHGLGAQVRTSGC